MSFRLAIDSGIEANCIVIVLALRVRVASAATSTPAIVGGFATAVPLQYTI